MPKPEIDSKAAELQPFGGRRLIGESRRQGARRWESRSATGRPGFSGPQHGNAQARHSGKHPLVLAIVFTLCVVMALIFGIVVRHIIRDMRRGLDR